MSDAVTSLDETVRTVTAVEVDGAPGCRQVLARTYPTDVEDLWDALTDAERIPRWFLPITGDLKVGGSYRFEGNAGGVVEECEPPRRFRVTWGMGDQVTWVTVTLEPDGDGTRLELEHLGAVPAELWAVFGPSATGMGWDGGLHGLDRHIRTGEAMTPDAAMAWMTSPEGLAFMERSGDLWAAADVAGGTDPAEAAERAKRCIDVYTGRAEPPQH